MRNHPIPDLTPLRKRFPALAETGSDGRPFAFFDGPAGTQVPESVIEAMSTHLVRANALAGGSFVVSQRCQETVEAARAAMADFFNAAGPEEIVFGPNMTTLTWQMSRAIARMLKPGDEIVVTELDHYANVSPWVALEEKGIVVRRARFNPADCRLDLDHLAELINEKTHLVAVGYASNLVGTINPIAAIAEMAHGV
ncbi:MAG: aminotransferase class V-fold PLP-dependent enzyme, partial [Thermoanaerobaculia bacterium]|nr:aminotransferase class V-fold PLP-dependent enzyme [Thermoanaerobaculia bacterium]